MTTEEREQARLTCEREGHVPGINGFCCKRCDYVLDEKARNLR